MKTSITQNGSSVVVTYTCNNGGRHTREFRTNSMNAGYVHEVFESGARQQVGEGLYHSGNMLYCSAEKLGEVIRREWRKARKDMKNEPTRYCSKCLIG